jgi:hypothetical protein
MSEQPQLCKQAFNTKTPVAGYIAPHKRTATVATFDTAFPELAKSVTELKQHNIWAKAADKLKGVAPVNILEPASTDAQPPTYAELLTGIKVIDVSNDPYYAWEPLEKKPQSAFWAYVERKRNLDKQKPKFMFTEDLIEAEEAEAAKAECEELYSDTEESDHHEEELEQQ